MMDRRHFLKTVGLSSLAYFTAEATVPDWIIRSAGASPLNCLTGDRILVIIQQSGGNDGLNTVIPISDSIYYDALTRPNIRVPAGSALTLDANNGLHPRLANLANWMQQGKGAIIQNVGYVNPDLSHFTSTDYYETASVPGQPLPTKGWLAKYYDNACDGTGDPEALLMAATGTGTVPHAFQGSASYLPPAIASASSYSLSTTGDRTFRLNAISGLNSLATSDPDIDFLRRSQNVMAASVDDIATANAIGDLVPDGSYSVDSLGNGLKLASKIIRGGFRTRIFYVSQGGYDTHANQIQSGDPLNAGDHPALLSALDQSVSAFLTEMQISGNLDRVLLMTFSEFGRRVKENGSNGTDHGAANSMFVFGGGLTPGIYGGQPDLLNTIKGNLRHQVDFRSVYSTIIENWFEANPLSVFGQDVYTSTLQPDYAKIPFVKMPTAAKGWNLYA